MAERKSHAMQHFDTAIHQVALRPRLHEILQHQLFSEMLTDEDEKSSRFPAVFRLVNNQTLC